VALQPPNSTIQISLERDGKPLDVAVVVGERKEQNQDSQFIPLPER
jgi:serine protease DegS